MTDDWITCEHCGMTYNPVMRHSCGEQAMRKIEARRMQIPSGTVAHMGGVIAQLNARIEELEREREEAWQAARFILADLAGYRRSNRDRWISAYPRLKEEPR